MSTFGASGWDDDDDDGNDDGNNNGSTDICKTL